MPEVAAPPSAAPAKTVTPPTPSAAPPMESKKPPQEPDGVFDDAFAAINDLDSGKPAPKKEAAKKPNPPTAADAETSDTSKDSDAEVTADDALTKSNGQTKPDQTKNGEQKPFKAAELRTAYENLKKKIAEDYEPKVKRLPELEAKLKEFESRDETVGKATQERIQAIEKRNAELEQAVRLYDYKQGPEYKQLEQEWGAMWDSAMTQIDGITITRTNTETGEEISKELTADDLNRYAWMNPKSLWNELKAEIPDPAERTIVINHIHSLQSLISKFKGAEARAKLESETAAQKQAEQQRQSMAQRQKLWQATNETLAKKYPKWFGKEEGDDEGNDLLDRGAALADLVFSPSDLTAERIEKLPKVFKEAIESKKPFSQEAMVKLHAIARNKIANHDRAIKRLNAAQARIAELEKSLKQYEESSPEDVPAGGKRSITPAGFAEASSELEALDRKFK